MDKYKLYEKIKRTIKRKNRRPYPLFSKEEYINKYDWMILNILFPGNDKNKLNISSVRIMQIKNGKYPNILRYINTRFSDNSIYKNSSKLLQENIYRILYHINVHPVCPVCHKFSPYRYKYYLNAIKIWTIKDVEKRNCAKEHNLNFKEVWSLQEGKEFINDLYTKREIP